MVYRDNDLQNKKKKKEITPAGNGTQRTNYTPLGILFFAYVTQRKRYGKKQRRSNRGQLNTEGAVAKSPRYKTLLYYLRNK
jgi:hypothetical protein